MRVTYIANGAPICGDVAEYAWVDAFSPDHLICVTLEGEALRSLKRRHVADPALREMPGASGGNVARLREWVECYLRGYENDAPFGLLMRGTPFQHAVWQRIAAIPRGKTISYAQLALMIGKPKAVRAVGTACGANPLPLLVPCHRVLGSDGRPGGFGWGLEIKERLLAFEKSSQAVRHAA